MTCSLPYAGFVDQTFPVRALEKWPFTGNASEGHVPLRIQPMLQVRVQDLEYSASPSESVRESPGITDVQASQVCCSVSLLSFGDRS